MELFEQIEWSHWKIMTDFEKNDCLRQLLMYFVPPTIDVSRIDLVNFELYGIKCRTFELEFDGELFVFIPKNSEAILGWDLGAQGLRPHELLGFDEFQLEHTTFKTNLTKEAISPSSAWIEEEDAADLHTLEGISAYINCRTTPLRKARIPAMFVQKYALPAGTEFLGMIDAVTGTFEGEVERYAPYESVISDKLFPKLSEKASFTWTFPKTILEKNTFYLDFVPAADCYFYYSHTECTHDQLRKKLQKKGFDLLTEDQWEYVVGAGSRRLFRWGNELLVKDNESGKQIKGKMNGANMFGLVFDTQQTRYELTKNSAICKLNCKMQPATSLIEQMLPLSTYYRSNHSLSSTQKLTPDGYLYRKSITITL